MGYTPLYEIEIRGKWHPVTLWIFRSWGGPRRIDGVLYTGPQYYLGSKQEV